MSSSGSYGVIKNGRSVGNGTALLIHGIIQLPEDNTPEIEPLEMVVYRDLVMLFSRLDDATVANMDATSPARRARLADYRQTNNRLAVRYPMLPMRFGMVVDDADEIQNFLSGNYLYLHTVLEQLSNKVEFVVRISWDLPTVLHYLHEQQIVPIPTIVGSEPDRRIEVGCLLYQATERHKQVLREQLWTYLDAIIIERCELPREADSTLVNTSLLIVRDDEALLEQAIGAYAEASPDYLELDYSGPLPPYSFAPLRFEKGNFTAIDEARRTLELPERASGNQIKQAYRRFARLTHPDMYHNLDDGRFKQIRTAYDLLRSYCRSCGEESAESIYSFTPDAIQHVFMARQD